MKPENNKQNEKKEKRNSKVIWGLVLLMVTMAILMVALGTSGEHSKELEENDHSSNTLEEVKDHVDEEKSDSAEVDGTLENSESDLKLPDEVEENQNLQQEGQVTTEESNQEVKAGTQSSVQKPTTSKSAPKSAENQKPTAKTSTTKQTTTQTPVTQTPTVQPPVSQDTTPKTDETSKNQMHSAVIKINDKSSVYGEDEQKLDFTVVSTVNITVNELKNSQAIVISKERGDDVGTYAITGQNTNPNWSITIKEGTYEIMPRKMTVRIKNSSSRVGNEITSLNYTIEKGSFAAGDKAENVFKLSTTADKNKVGTYKIAGEVVCKNYDITFIEGRYSVERERDRDDSNSSGGSSSYVPPSGGGEDKPPITPEEPTKPEEKPNESIPDDNKKPTTDDPVNDPIWDDDEKNEEIPDDEKDPTTGEDTKDPMPGWGDSTENEDSNKNDNQDKPNESIPDDKGNVNEGGDPPPSWGDEPMPGWEDTLSVSDGPMPSWGDTPSVSDDPMPEW